MRKLSKKEKQKRGCKYCTDHKGEKCKYAKCPYHELDRFKDYEDYFNKQQSVSIF